MKHTQLWTSRALIAVTAFALCGVPESVCAYAQEPQSTQPQTTQTQQQGTLAPEATQQAPATPAAAPQRGTTIDPSQGPLTPIPTQTPEATAPAQDQVENPSPAPPSTIPATPQPQQTDRQRNPLGAAAAEGVKTEGGGASRPAGTAIAPAKQRQVRSFLIKFSAIAAAGVALGTVYALSKGTSSTPPNSGR